MKAAILGATGLVGQRFVQMLSDHEWFEIAALTGSERSSGVEYGDVVNWRMETPLKKEVAELTVQPSEPKSVDADVVFSALPAEQAQGIEEDFAKQGFAVVSNASSHRMDPDVPLMNPEANFTHLSLIDEQRRKRKWDGSIVTNPNCTTAVLTLSLKPIFDAFWTEKCYRVHHAGSLRGRIPRRSFIGHNRQRNPIHQRRRRESSTRDRKDPRSSRTFG